MNEMKMFEREFGAAATEVGGEPEAGGSNLWVLLQDRMQGRWKWAVATGLVLGSALAAVGFHSAKLEYSASGLVQVDFVLPTLVSRTPETSELPNFQAFMGSQAVLMRDSRVLMDALRSDQLQPHLVALGEDPMRTLQDGLRANVLGGTNLISVSYSGGDRRLAQAAVNSVLDSYFRLYGPNAETQHTNSTQQLRGLITDARRRIAELENERERVIRDSVFGTLDSGILVQERVAALVTLQEQLRSLEILREEIVAAASAEDRSPAPDDVPPPSDAMLFEVDQPLRSMREELLAVKTELDLAAARFSEQHPSVRQLRNRLSALDEGVAARRQWLIENWKQQVGSTRSLRAIDEQIARIREQMAPLRQQIDQDQRDRSRVAAINNDVARIRGELGGFQSRLAGLETESESIRRGRVVLRSPAQIPSAPSRDRRIQYGAAGFMGGFGASLFGFFLIGSIDRRAFAARQLEADRGRLRPLGVIPDMSRLGDSDEERMLLEDCIHRIRNRIEVRRPHTDGGYAIKVSSPLQGDGKTSVAASLGWSYAQAGYRTILVDADFIGRALSHQFGLLGRPGVREAMRSIEKLPEFVHQVRPNLEVIAAGADRSMSAGHLQLGGVREFIAHLRRTHEIVIVDSGPMSASVESLPVIGAVDGVVLVLRRGRNRNRLSDCIEDIRHVGSEYLGVVLNHASLADCQRYSSLSRVSAEVEASDAGRGADGRAEAQHPVVSALGQRTLGGFEDRGANGDDGDRR